MFCSKIGADCPHAVEKKNDYVFVLMPFKDSDSVYDAIKQAVEESSGKKFTCERADEKFTHVSIWCKRICSNIRRAKYLIADTTGKNANVFYELGFAHALDSTSAIIITQNLNDAPFDIRDLNHIEYSEKKLPELREKLKKAIEELEKEEPVKGYEGKSADEMIGDLKKQIRSEEERASRFKKELTEGEEREGRLKKQILELEAIQKNPVEEAQKKITEMEGTVSELRSRLKFAEGDQAEIKRLQAALEEKENKLKSLGAKYSSYRTDKDKDKLSEFLLVDSKRRSEALILFRKANEESEKKNHDKAIELYSKCLQLDNTYAMAHYNRGNSYSNLRQYEKAVADYDKAIELDPKLAVAYSNRGNRYFNLRQYEKAIADYDKAIELDPKLAITYSNRGYSYGKLRQYEKAIADYDKAIECDPKFEGGYFNLAELHLIKGAYEPVLKILESTDSIPMEEEVRATKLYLQCIVKKLLAHDFTDSLDALNEVLGRDITLTWSFDEIEDWLTTAEIDSDAKSFIKELTELMKKHER